MSSNRNGSPGTAAKSSSPKGVALVTGATGIIGPAICKALRHEGWVVAACDRDHKDFDFLDRVLGQRVEADGTFVADLSEHDRCHNLVAEIERTLGPIGLLVNNAAVNLGPAKLGELTEDACQLMTRVNIFAPLFLMQAAEASLAANGGSVVNISSVLSQRTGREGDLMYSLLKAALERMTEAVAVEFAPKGVRANAIRVGSVPGYAFMRRELERLPVEAARRLYAEVMPLHYEAADHNAELGRRGCPEDIAELVCFLASPRAAYMTGSILPMDGGYTHQIVRPDGPKKTWNPRQAVADWLAREGFTTQEQNNG